MTKIDELKTILLDENQSLFERYRALFALRNIATDEAVLAICEGTSCPFLFCFAFRSQESSWLTAVANILHFYE